MKIICPFLRLFDTLVDCVYREGRSCTDIKENPGNCDAWCSERIDERLQEEYPEGEAIQ